ncbi:MAG: short-subunit dehydrogenase [Candidatus Azotimanducaceae bacterium]|jgi:short-subunit dehydrogenase
MRRLKESVCLLTGATGGIGRAVASALAHQGAKLVLTARTEKDLDDLAESLPAGSVRLVQAADMTKSEDRLSLTAAAEIANVDTLINLAGANGLQSFERQNESTQAHLLELNLMAPMCLTHQMLPVLKMTKNPTILNVGSTFGSIGFPGYATYCASKFGLRGFSEALRRELAGRVRVLYIAPRTTKTTMNKGHVNALNQALGNTEDEPSYVANQIVSAIVKGRTNVILGWPEKLFARINQLMPSVVDRAIYKKLPKIQAILSEVDPHCSAHNPQNTTMLNSVSLRQQ